MSEVMYERARELGRLIGQTNEYQALQRARDRVSNDREVVTLLNRLADLESRIGQALQRGEEPDEETRTSYEAAFSELQGNAAYQSLVAAQSNLDRILSRVNEEIGKGMEAGGQSRIILPS